VSNQLPTKSWFILSVLLHIHLHSKYLFKVSDGKATDSRGFSFNKISSLFSMIESSILSWEKPLFYKNYWENYYEEDIETEEYIKSKEQVIKDWLQFINPDSVLDLGANTGRFSIIASSFAKKVISLESDESCVDEIVRQIDLKKLKNIYPFIGDLAEPSPSLGLMNKEVMSLFQRSKSEVVMGLALIHHLYFTKDMSFVQIAELLFRFCHKYLIVEFIPKDDRKVIGLIESKPQREEDYTFEIFMLNMCVHFNHLKSYNLKSSTRILLFFEVK
jgi:SAM-dependent methyltransferase